jgi:DNA-3-methyladenine glycosylase
MQQIIETPMTKSALPGPALRDLLAPTLAPLPREFYAPDAGHVARLLLGHVLVRNTRLGFLGGIIVETEAYLADDPACHAFRGPTPRNRAMFGPPGYAYVYFIYGNHWCFNAVCRGEGVGEAVLIRAVVPVFGLQAMHRNRPVARRRELTNGPGKLCEALRIDRRHDHCDLCDPRSPVFIASNPHRAPVMRRLGPVETTIRIGIQKAAQLPLRFLLERSEFVSRRVQT